MELDIKTLDLLPAQEESNLAACEITCGHTCRTNNTCANTIR
ncbi:ALQxL family class IV lanthipeptide [Streptosporangium sp. G11]